jgi:hypothetical protein
VAALAILSSRTAAADTLTLAWDPNPEPEVLGYVVRVGTEPGVYSKKVDVGKTTTWTFADAVAGQRYCFVVAAYAAEVGEGPNSAEVCGMSNTPPVFTNPGAQTSNVGQSVSLQLRATDPEGMPITYGASSLPPGLSIAASTGLISGVTTTAGTYTVQATASDGVLVASVSFTWTVGAALPGAARLVSPTGAIATVTPTYVWESVPTATHYRLYVEDMSPIDPRINAVFTSSEAGCAAGGTCRVTPGTALAPGEATWSIRASNAGGEGPWSEALAFMVPSGTPPTVTILSPTTSPEFSTTAATLTVGGSAADDVGVTSVTWSNSRGGSGTASGTTSWTVAGIQLLAGSNVITVTARDGAGNTGTDVLTATLTDGEAPVVTITSPTSGSSYATSSSAISLGGTAADAFGVRQVTWTSDRGPSGVAAGTSTWSIASVPLQSGANTITVKAVDAAGHAGTDAIVVTVTDGGAPAVTIQSPTTSSTYSTASTTVSLAGVASDDIGVTQVTWSNSRGGSGIAGGTTSWSTGPIALQPGDNTLTVTARDAAGNSASDVLLVRLPDAEPPVVAIAAPTAADAFSTTSTSMRLAGTARDNSTISQVYWANNRGGTGVASGTTSWTTSSIPLQVGSNLLTVTARDAAGNTSSDLLSVTRADYQAPAVTIMWPTTSALYSTSLAYVPMVGTASSAAGITQVKWTSSTGASGSATLATSPYWYIQYIPLQLGTNTITVTARDGAGNSASDVITITRLSGTTTTTTYSSSTTNTGSTSSGPNVP